MYDNGLVRGHAWLTTVKGFPGGGLSIMQGLYYALPRLPPVEARR